MKKKLLSVLATTVLCIVTATSSFGASGVIRNGSVLVPLRGVFENLGFKVYWNSDTETAQIFNENYSISIQKNADTFVVNGKTISPDTPQTIIDGTMYLPLRALGDAVSAQTSWNEENKSAVIELNGKKVTVYTDKNYIVAGTSENLDLKEPTTKAIETTTETTTEATTEVTTEETTTGSTTATVDEYAGFAGVRYSLRKQVIADLQKAQKQYHVGNADTLSLMQRDAIVLASNQWFSMANSNEERSYIDVATEFYLRFADAAKAIDEYANRTSDTTSKAMYKAQADDFKDRMDAIVDSFSMCKSISDVNNAYNSMYDLSRQIRRFNW